MDTTDADCSLDYRANNVELNYSMIEDRRLNNVIFLDHYQAYIHR